MKSKVLNRPMFLDAENVGIMQGFKDEEEMIQDEGYEMDAMIDRTPSSPEILMNNLRGDMRSIDARLEELAQLVGDEAAMETPPEVLALLQPVLAQQEGIGSLPAGMPQPPMDPSMMPPSDMGAAMPAPDMGMMPPEMGMPPGAPPMMPPDAGMMPQGPMPTAQAPLQMADGGLVQRFRDGSDEEGVTPVQPRPPVDPYSAQALLQQLDSRRDPEALSRTFEDMLPMYQQALGTGDRSMTQAQILFDISQAGLNLAAGTDSQGRPVRGSFASRLASAAQGLPDRISQRAGQLQQQEQAARVAALRGAQEETSAQRNLETKVMTDFAMADRQLRDQQRLAAQNAASSAAQADLAFQRQMLMEEFKTNLALGKQMTLEGLKPPPDPFSDTRWSNRTVLGLADNYALGRLNAEQDDLFEQAVIDMAKARETSTTDDRGYTTTVVTPGVVTPQAVAALKARGRFDIVAASAGFSLGDLDPRTLELFAKEAEERAERIAAMASQPGETPVVTSPDSPDALTATGPGTISIDLQEELARVGGDASKMSQESQARLAREAQPMLEGLDVSWTDPASTVWGAHTNATGMFNQMGIIFGDYVPFDWAAEISTRAKQAESAIDQKRNQFINAFRQTARLSDSERQMIEKNIGMQIRFLQPGVSYRNNLISLADTLDQLERQFTVLADDRTATRQTANLNRDKAAEIRILKNILGAPRFVRTQADREWLAQQPAGTEYLIRDADRDMFVLQRR